jgi:hypothetical protein
MSGFFLLAIEPVDNTPVTLAEQTKSATQLTQTDGNKADDRRVRLTKIANTRIFKKICF